MLNLLNIDLHVRFEFTFQCKTLIKSAIMTIVKRID